MFGCVKMNPEECCGCGLCAVICPAGAIEMKVDDCGFFLILLHNRISA